MISVGQILSGTAGASVWVALVLALKCAPESQVDRLQRRHLLFQQLLLSLSFAELCELGIRIQVSAVRISKLNLSLKES